jgi:hypothetical protein
MSAFATFSLVVSIIYAGATWYSLVTDVAGFRSFRVTRSEGPTAFWTIITLQVIVAGTFAVLFIYDLLTQ